MWSLLLSQNRLKKRQRTKVMKQRIKNRVSKIKKKIFLRSKVKTQTRTR